MSGEQSYSPEIAKHREALDGELKGARAEMAKRNTDQPSGLNAVDDLANDKQSDVLDPIRMTV